MDGFPSEELEAVRARARDLLGRWSAAPGPGPLDPLRWEDEAWAALGVGVNNPTARAVAIDEAAAVRPRFAAALLRQVLKPTGGSAGEFDLYRLARMTGTAAHLCERAIEAARAKGIFASSLFGFREVQGRLADAATGVEALRLGVLRAGHLLERGATDRAQAELGLFLKKARALLDDTAAVARDLLGPGWLSEALPEEDGTEDPLGERRGQ